MTNTYRSLFTGKELDEAIIYIRDMKNTESIESGSLAIGETKTLFSFDYTKNNYAQICVSAENTAGQLFVLESKTLVSKTGSNIDEIVSTMGHVTDLFTIDSYVSDGKAHLLITAIQAIKNIKSIVTNIL